jgi:hypothetical protein
VLAARLVIPLVIRSIAGGELMRLAKVAAPVGRRST